MDAQARKLFGMLGSAYAGERRNAFDRLDKYLEGKGLTLPRLWAADLETELAAATADIAKLQTALAVYKSANAAAAAQNKGAAPDVVGEGQTPAFEPAQKDRPRRRLARRRDRLLRTARRRHCRAVLGLGRRATGSGH